MTRKKTGAFTANHPFGKPEEINIIRILSAVAFVIVGLSFIVWMVASAPEEKRLKCSGPSSLIGFGSCVLDEQ